MFEMTLPREVICGTGKLWEISKRTKGKRIFLVIDPNVYLSLKKQISEFSRDCQLFTFSEITSEPTVEIVNKAVNLCRQENSEIIVGIGGGSVLDTGKAISFLCKNPGSASDYQMGKRAIENTGLFYVAIPTTAGTGSEATKTAVITNKTEGIKKSINHPYLVPDLVVLDANLTLTLSPNITALTGIDALSHAIESYVSLGANPFTKAVGLKAIELIGKNLKEVTKNGGNLKARENMLIASYLGGLSLNGGVGIAHILAQPIGAVCGLSHAEAIGVVLAETVEANANYASDDYLNIGKTLGRKVKKPQEVSEIIKELCEEVGIKNKLSDFGVGKEKISEILLSASKSTMHIKTNPQPVSEEILRKVLRKSF